MTISFKSNGYLPIEERERLRRVIFYGKNWRRKLSALRKLNDQDFYKLRATNSGHWLDRAQATHFLVDTNLLQRIREDPKEDPRVKDIAGIRYLRLLR